MEFINCEYTCVAIILIYFFPFSWQIAHSSVTAGFVTLCPNCNMFFKLTGQCISCLFANGNNMYLVQKLNINYCTTNMSEALCNLSTISSFGRGGKCTENTKMRFFREIMNSGEVTDCLL